MTLLTSLIVSGGQKNKLPFPQRLPIAAFHFVTNGLHLFTYWLQATSVVSYSRDVSNMQENMRPRLRGKGVESLALSSEFARSYRILGVLQQQFSSLYQHYMSQNQTAMAFCVVLNMLQAVVDGNLRSLVIALLLTLGFIKFLEATAEVYHTS